MNSEILCGYAAVDFRDTQGQLAYIVNINIVGFQDGVNCDSLILQFVICNLCQSNPHY